MIVSDKPEEIYLLAGRCPAAAMVLADPTGARFRLLFLGSGTAQTESDAAKAIAAGLTAQAGIVGLTRQGKIETVAKPGAIFPSLMARASMQFRIAIEKLQIEIAELERIAGLMDRRAQT